MGAEAEMARVAAQLEKEQQQLSLLVKIKVRCNGHRTLSDHSVTCQHSHAPCISSGYRGLRGWV